MTGKTMADLRDLVHEIVNDARTCEKSELERMRVLFEGLHVAVNVVKVQVAYASIVKGDLELPYMQEPPPESHTRTVVDPLASGPSADHPWRRSVHRLGR